MSIQTRKFIIEVDVNTEKIPDPNTAADELHDAIGYATFPEWLYSVNGIDPGPEEL